MFCYFTWPFFIFTVSGSIAESLLDTAIENIIYKKNSNDFFYNGFFIGLTIGTI